MKKMIACQQCEGTGTVLLDQQGNIVDAPLFAPLLERVTCDDCDGSGRVEDEDAEYSFDELDEDAKEYARDKYRERGSDSSDFECVIEDAVRMGNMLGIDFDTRSWTNSYGYHGSEPKIWWSGFCSQGDGASFEGSYSYKKGALKAIMAEAPATWINRDGTPGESKGNAMLHRIARDLQHAQAAEFYSINTRISQSGHYYHENTMSFDHVRGEFGNQCEQDYYESDATEQIEEALRDFARWIYWQLENEDEWMNSDEYIDEMFEANDYKFDAEGRRV